MERFITEILLTRIFITRHNYAGIILVSGVLISAGKKKKGVKKGYKLAEKGV